jgi:tRNA(Ile)-lysidine synthase
MDEIKRQKSIVLSHKIAVEISENKVWIAPYTNVVMDKQFKEKCRVNKIPKNIRAYLSTKQIDIKSCI